LPKPFKTPSTFSAFEVEQGSLEAGQELQSPKGALLRDQAQDNILCYDHAALDLRDFEGDECAVRLLLMDQYCFT